jgi:hypothetical protein
LEKATRRINLGQNNMEIWRLTWRINQTLSWRKWPKEMNLEENNMKIYRLTWRNKTSLVKFYFWNQRYQKIYIGVLLKIYRRCKVVRDIQVIYTKLTRDVGVGKKKEQPDTNLAKSQFIIHKSQSFSLFVQSKIGSPNQ